jgi:RNA polymerase sigma factor (sigma-70 family)
MPERESTADEPASLSVLLADWTAAESAAVRRIYGDYFPRLRALSQRVLGRLPGAATDADDVVQSALQSLCRFMRARGDDAARDRDDIWRLLCHVVTRKSQRRVQRQTRGLRGGKLRPATDLEGADGPAWDVVASTLPTEQFDVLVAEALEGLDPPLQQIALLALEGWTQAEIAEQLGCARRTVIRKFELIRGALQESRE